jgi:hypothetical protein
MLELNHVNNPNSLDSHGSNLGRRHHPPRYSILCEWWGGNIEVTKLSYIPK